MIEYGSECVKTSAVGKIKNNAFNKYVAADPTVTLILAMCCSVRQKSSW